jgi:hypothetical protein
MLPFRKVTDNDPNRIQANIKEFADSVVSLPILSGNLLEDIVLSSTQTLVPHKLGREIRGYMIVAKNANIDVWRSATTLPKQFLPLTASGTVTVSLWVF